MILIRFIFVKCRRIYASAIPAKFECNVQETADNSIGNISTGADIYIYIWYIKSMCAYSIWYCLLVCRGKHVINRKSITNDGGGGGGGGSIVQRYHQVHEIEIRFVWGECALLACIVCVALNNAPWMYKLFCKHAAISWQWNACGITSVFSEESSDFWWVHLKKT